MARNIILCADGTGNRGGYTPDSNVYKLYNAVARHDPTRPQVTFYDNGLGTAVNKYWRALTGGLGLGFKRNVLDLYQYLARHYDPGDAAFLFGFSRGAATVRAFAGLIATAGLVDGRRLSGEALAARVEEAFRVYRRAGGDPARGNAAFGEHGAIPIRFIGVWDTVSALGIPQVPFLDRLIDRVFPHRFYHYELTGNVAHACQALALDDERQTFTPMVWDERTAPETVVEQVWFAGAHSNVGGGYGRAGLANVTLAWMLARAEQHGLVLKPGVRSAVERDAHVHGRLYDSRDGAAVFYRYRPRDVAALCRDKMHDLRIHRSVFERMQKRTGNYAPGSLPHTFIWTETPVDHPSEPARSADDEADWQRGRREIGRWVRARQHLYTLFVTGTLALVAWAGWLWNDPDLMASGHTRPADAALFERLMGHLADVVNYFTPVYFEGLVTVALIRHPLLFWSGLLVFLAMVAARWYFKRQERSARERARERLLAASVTLHTAALQAVQEA